MEYQISNERLTLTGRSLGGEMISVRDNTGREYIWSGDTAYWSGHAPVLFPICGSLRDDRALLKNGKTTAMPRHGLVRKKEFTLVEKQADSLTFKIASTPETEEQFPFPFQLYTNYTLKEDTVAVTFRVVNPGREPLPFILGGHPGFNCPLSADEDFADYWIEFAAAEDLQLPTPVTSTGLIDVSRRQEFLKGQNKFRLSHDLFAVDGLICDQLISRRVKYYSEKTGHGAELDFAQFPYLILWSTANRGPFIAMEPWLGLSTCSDEGDVFEDKRNIQTAAPGEAREYTFTIRFF